MRCVQNMYLLSPRASTSDTLLKVLTDPHHSLHRTLQMTLLIISKWKLRWLWFSSVYLRVCWHSTLSTSRNGVFHVFYSPQPQLGFSFYYISKIQAFSPIWRKRQLSSRCCPVFLHSQVSRWTNLPILCPLTNLPFTPQKEGLWLFQWNCSLSGH